MNIQERLAIFYQRLGEAPPPRDASEALQLISRLLAEVEDQYCPVPPRHPPPLEFDGRMYPPQPDRIQQQPDGSLLGRTRGHWILISSRGEIKIFSLRRRVLEYLKPGST